MDQRPIGQIQSKPGIQRDGTTLDSPNFVDGQWVRFYRTRPRKMGGFRSIIETLTYTPRGLSVFTKNNTNSLYVFSSNDIQLIQTDTNLTGSIPYDVTPAAGFTPNDDYLWQTGGIYDATGGGDNIILAHASSNLNDISSSTDHPIFYSTAGDSTSLFAKVDDGAGGDVQVSGGICVLQPYVFAFGNDGFIKNSNQNKPNDWRMSVGTDANEGNFSYTKVVCGMPIRGGGNSPSGLFWSLDSLIKVSYAGGQQVFNYDPVGLSTIMSSNGVSELDGMFFWMGVDRFYVYDGRIQELPNQMNINWVFDNINFAQRQKVWSTVVPRWGEIWWHFPFGQNQVECNRAVIYNMREKTWYDCEISRGCGVPPQTLRNPIWCGNTEGSSGYIAHSHEVGYNKVESGQEVAIKSYIETSDFGFPTGGTQGEQPTGQDYFTRLTRVEPDFVQVGNLTLSVIGNEFAQDQAPVTTDYTFPAQTTKIDMREQRRMIRLRITSNEVDGFYEMGRTILHTEPGDIRS